MHFRIALPACLIALPSCLVALPACLIALLIAAPLLAENKKAFDTQKRVPWTRSTVVGAPDPPPPFRVQQTFKKLELKQPVYVLREPGSDFLWVVQHLGHWSGPGKIVRFRDDPDVSDKQLLLEQDRLIYGMTFHPKFEQNGYFYLISNGPVKAATKFNRITRHTVKREPEFSIEPDSELVILEWEANGHNGGDLAFGPDGNLYIPCGDGTSDSDANDTGQDLKDLLATMIRIDVDRPQADKPYSIPTDNPFIGVEGARPEIWAYGFRNPWRMCIDHKTGLIWVGNNGQDLWEQVFLVTRGGNYGWSVNEGDHPFQLQRKRGPTPILPPAIDHPHSEFRSLTGGVVYYGADFPELQGTYIYGDFSTGKIWGARHDGQRIRWNQELADTSCQITGFGLDRRGELLVLDSQSGVQRLERTPREEPTRRFPRKLSETGLFTDVKQHAADPGLIPYSVNAALWSDGAYKERYIALPDDAKIEYAANRGWKFDDGAVLVKSFALDMEEGRPQTRRWIETRLLTKQQNEWVGYSYAWNAEQTDALLVEAVGRDRPLLIQDAAAPGGKRDQTWHYPSRAECMVCHSRAANFVLGLSELQMNRPHDYGGVTENQLTVLDRLDAFQKKLEKPPSEVRHLVDPYDTRADLNERARSYLHANCANCHIGAGGGNALMELEFTTERDKAHVFDVKPQHHGFGIADARLIATGQPDRSMIYQRVARRGAGQMPPLATSRVDQAAVKLLAEWITQLPPPKATDAAAEK